MNITETFISGISSVCNRSFSRQLKDRVRLLFLDYLACVVGGSAAMKSTSMRDLLIEEKGMGNNHIVGRPDLYPKSTAALINGISAHFLELDDGYRRGAIHIGAPVFSALLAVAEIERFSYDGFVRGVVAGYEACARLACAVQPGCRQRGYHATGVCGTVGAAIGIAFALGYTGEQLKTAISASVAGAAGVLEMQEDASELKPYNAGRAAMDAVMAVYMAKAGFRGPNDPIGGKRGFLNVMTDNPNIKFLTDFVTDEFQVEQAYLKLYSACRHAHPAIEASLILRDRIKIDEIKSIKVYTYKQATEGHSHKAIQSVSSAKMSIPFSVALAFINGSAGIDSYTEVTIKDSTILNAMQLITVIADDELTSLNPQKRAAIVEVNTHFDSYYCRVDYPKGEPENPLSKSDIEQKFLQLSMYAGINEVDRATVINEINRDNPSIEIILSSLSL